MATKREINTEKLNKLIRDFREKYPKLDYFTLDEIVQYMDMAFCLGHDVGMEIQKRTCIRVRRSDNKQYKSITDAARKNQVSESAIRKAIKYNSKSAGYNWQKD